MSPHDVVRASHSWGWSDDDIIECVSILMNELHKKRAIKRGSTCILCCGDKRLHDGRPCPKCR